MCCSSHFDLIFLLSGFLSKISHPPFLTELRQVQWLQVSFAAGLRRGPDRPGGHGRDHGGGHPGGGRAGAGPRGGPDHHATGGWLLEALLSKTFGAAGPSHGR